MLNKNFKIQNGLPSYLECKYVDWDCFEIGQGSQIIKTDGVSSCLAVTIYDTQTKKGILAHVTGFDDVPRAFKPQRIIRTLLYRLDPKRQMDYQKLEATLAGEGIKTNTAHEKSGIIRPILNQYEIPIIGEDLGYIGLKGRLIFLHCETGLVEVFRA